MQSVAIGWSVDGDVSESAYVSVHRDVGNCDGDGSVDSDAMESDGSVDGDADESDGSVDGDADESAHGSVQAWFCTELYEESKETQ